MKESEERFKSIIENSPSAIFLKDVEGRYTITSSKFKEWYRISGTDEIGQTSHDVLPKDFADVAVELDEQTLTTGAPCEREVNVSFADGSMHWVHLQISCA